YFPTGIENVHVMFYSGATLFRILASGENPGFIDEQVIGRSLDFVKPVRKPHETQSPDHANAPNASGSRKPRDRH
ncbi:MAG TPA: hypothetical protein VFC46_00075, partial [Humisphaera sp.]|nr:hypothetical protein [Humisphaera sp.]